ncbi:MAG: serine/threonine protein kinase [Planctomycetaceae bacterium]|nr:serine/threonine protein kinase [Planctomycetaceae bacterium]
MTEPFRSDTASTLVHVSTDPVSADEVPTVPGSHENRVDRRTGHEPAVIPGYEVLGELGRGGMGVVYRARQVGANREVALKVVLTGSHASPTEVARFRTEAEAVARLQHPHVVAVFEVGEHDGRPFYSMELCPGDTLAKAVSDGPFDPRVAANTVLKVARGVAAAHDAGVIHRDLKPGNVLLTADGEPKVADFGLAKRLDAGSDAGLTRTGVIVGTPSYMPPEQAAGVREIGPAADIYSLGAVLYELLTGRPPFRGPTATDTILLVVTEDPVPPRVVRPDVPRDLDAVVLRCLEKDPARRYRTAATLADDIQRFLDGDPVSAARSGVVGRLAGAIDRVQPHERFASYGSLLLALAPVMLFPEVWNTLALESNWPAAAVMGGRAVQAFAFLGLIAYFRGRDLWPRGPAERQLWAVWGGYFLACFGYGLSGWAMIGMAHHEVGKFYPGFACLTALAFFSLAANFWGYCGVIGAGFLALAFAMLAHLPLAPLAFGTAWAVVLVVVGQRLRRLGRVELGGTAPVDSSTTQVAR